MGEPGVWISSWMGSGSRGGRVRPYDMSWTLEDAGPEVNRESSPYCGGDRIEAESAGLYWELEGTGTGTATGFEGSFLSSDGLCFETEERPVEYCELGELD